VGVDLLEAGFGAVELWGADAVAVVKDLAVEVGEIDEVGIDDSDFSDSGGGEVEEGG